MKNHICILGWIYVGTCGLALLLGVILCALLWLDPSARSQGVLPWIGPPFLLAACLVLIPGLAGGIGLLRSCPWARALLLLPSALLLPILPVGTALGAYGLWTLLTPESQALFAGPSHVPLKPSPRMPSPLVTLLGLMAIVAAGFSLALKAGFAVHQDSPPALLESKTLTAAAMLVLGVGAVTATALAIRYGGRTRAKAHLRRNESTAAFARAEVRRLRVAELAADPARAHYSPLVERGQEWSDEDIAYDQDPNKTTTCAHLRPIERAMRRAGIKAHRYREANVVAKCRLDFIALQRDFPFALPVRAAEATPIRYSEFYQGERDAYDHPTAFLICDEHKSMIHVMHPEAAGAKDAPWFPAAPT